MDNFLVIIKSPIAILIIGVYTVASLLSFLIELLLLPCYMLKYRQGGLEKFPISFYDYKNINKNIIKWLIHYITIDDVYIQFRDREKICQILNGISIFFILLMTGVVGFILKLIINIIVFILKLVLVIGFFAFICFIIIEMINDKSN